MCNSMRALWLHQGRGGQAGCGFVHNSRPQSLHTERGWKWGWLGGCQVIRRGWAAGCRHKQCRRGVPGASAGKLASFRPFSEELAADESKDIETRGSKVQSHHCCHSASIKPMSAVVWVARTAVTVLGKCLHSACNKQEQIS